MGLDAVEMIMQAESVFEIDIPNAIATYLTTVGAL
jgi:acyl carrier protein